MGWWSVGYLNSAAPADKQHIRISRPDICVFCPFLLLSIGKEASEDPLLFAKIRCIRRHTLFVSCTSLECIAHRDLVTSSITTLIPVLLVALSERDMRIIRVNVINHVYAVATPFYSPQVIPLFTWSVRKCKSPKVQHRRCVCVSWTQ